MFATFYPFWFFARALFHTIQKMNIICNAKIRSSQEPQEVKITPIDNNSIKAEFVNMQKSVSPGQSIVLYHDDSVLGGGIIQEAY